MFALLIAVGALFLAVVVSVAIDPWPTGGDEADDGSPTIDAITFAI